jgi:hypothetical protein
LEKVAMADDEDQAERTHALNIDYMNPANEAAVKYAESAVKAMMLINGGASVSLLAFIGGLAAQGKVQLSGLMTTSGGAPLWTAVWDIIRPSR